MFAKGRKREEVINDYEGFVEKFKPKKTTDDCMTPPVIYECVAEFVERRYGVDRKRFVRPFYPGGDYENYPYPDDAVVVDNPPFSILSKILNFYTERNIPFFLFAGGLTIFSSIKNHNGVCAVVGGPVTYENGARVDTGFVTNMDTENLVVIDALFRDKLKQANESNVNKLVRKKHKYPSGVVTIGRLKKIKGVDMEIKRSDAVLVKKLDAQKGAAIYGCGLLVSPKVEEEIRQAEIKQAEINQADEVHNWQLSERERAITETLSCERG